MPRGSGKIGYSPPTAEFVSSEGAEKATKEKHTVKLFSHSFYPM